LDDSVFLVTAAHVVKNSTIKIMDPHNVFLSMLSLFVTHEKSLWISNDKDIAVINILSIPKDQASEYARMVNATIKKTDIKSVELGEEVLCYSPDTSEITFAFGHIVQKFTNSSFHLVSMQTGPGSSGSVVVCKGGLFGVISGEDYMPLEAVTRAERELRSMVHPQIGHLIDFTKMMVKNQRFCRVIDADQIKAIMELAPNGTRKIIFKNPLE
jgi:hypothetical protein